MVKQKIVTLAKDPYHPSLRTKYIKGEKDLFELSVSMKIRIILCYVFLGSPKWFFPLIIDSDVPYAIGKMCLA